MSQAESPALVLEALKAAGVEMALGQGNCLVVRPKSRVTTEVQQLLRAHKATLVEFLANEINARAKRWRVDLPPGISVLTTARFHAASVALDASQELHDHVWLCPLCKAGSTQVAPACQQGNHLLEAWRRAQAAADRFASAAACTGDALPTVLQDQTQGILPRRHE